MRFAVLLLVGLGAVGEASATVRELSSARAFCQVCRAARPAERLTTQGDAFQRGRARARHAEARLAVLDTVYTVTLAGPGFRLSEYDFDDGVLPVDTRRNFRLFDGVVELYASGNQAIQFEAEPDRARMLAQQHGRGRTRLKIGFLLAFDEPDSDPCLIRPSGAMTVRADLAYAELLDPDGRVLARMETERFDELIPEAQALGNAAAGQSPRPQGQVTLAPPTIVGEARRKAALEEFLAGDGAAQVSTLVRPCHAVGAQAAGRTRGSVVVTMDVDGGGGVANARPEVDSIGNAELTRCVVERMGGFRFPGGGHARVRVSVPLMFTDE